MNRQQKGTFEQATYLCIILTFRNDLYLFFDIKDNPKIIPLFIWQRLVYVYNTNLVMIEGTYFLVFYS